MPYYVVFGGDGGGEPLRFLVFRIVIPAFVWGTIGMLVLGLIARSFGLETVFADVLPDSEILTHGLGAIPVIFGMWQQFFGEGGPVPLGILLGFLIAAAILAFIVPRAFLWIFGLVPALAFWLVAGAGLPLSEQLQFDFESVTLLLGIALFALAGFLSALYVREGD